MKVRVARHTDRFGEVVAFYRDRVGLVEIGRFVNHSGYDGVLLEIPGTGAHLEFTTGGGHKSLAPDAESLVVLYFETQAELDAAAERVGQPTVETANPYWAEHARAFADPDGFLVLFALDE